MEPTFLETAGTTTRGPSGLQVREVPGVGWSVVTIWRGKVAERLSLYPDRASANRNAASIFEITKLAVERRVGVAPWLELAEAPDGTA